ncbi:hypothetical protein mRhiFer1_009882 [Rhinolophus ferrumequinum]|uniref:Uncharacterized protein n=1 Tax=Rhinolophus ferrumequinum TaxID=59479 RepID=A0A7J7YS97_RHIFE|nr:hypothetical protein mRhiFer1_009882 [Rhinolophus ferrumequinum]
MSKPCRLKRLEEIKARVDTAVVCWALGPQQTSSHVVLSEAPAHLSECRQLWNLCPLWKSETSTRAQLLVSKYHFPIKGTRLLRKIADSRAETEKKIQDEPGTSCNTRKKGPSPKGTQERTKLEQCGQKKNDN